MLEKYIDQAVAIVLFLTGYFFNWITRLGRVKFMDANVDLYYTNLNGTFQIIERFEMLIRFQNSSKNVRHVKFIDEANFFYAGKAQKLWFRESKLLPVLTLDGEKVGETKIVLFPKEADMENNLLNVIGSDFSIEFSYKVKRSIRKKVLYQNNFQLIKIDPYLT